MQKSQGSDSELGLPVIADENIELNLETSAILDFREILEIIMHARAVPICLGFPQSRSQSPRSFWLDIIWFEKKKKIITWE